MEQDISVRAGYSPMVGARKEVLDSSLTQPATYKPARDVVGRPLPFC